MSTPGLLLKAEFQTVAVSEVLEFSKALKISWRCRLLAQSSELPLLSLTVCPVASYHPSLPVSTVVLFFHTILQP